MPTQSLLIRGEINRATVTGIVFNHDGLVVVGKSIRYGWWQLPRGGNEVGEHPFRAVMREISEECGVTCSAKPITASAEFPAHRFPDNNPHEWYQAVRLGCQSFLMSRTSEKNWLKENGMQGKRVGNEEPEFDAIAFMDLKQVVQEAPPHIKPATEMIASLFQPIADSISLLDRQLQRDRDIIYQLRRTAADISPRFVPALSYFPGKYLPASARPA